MNNKNMNDMVINSNSEVHKLRNLMKVYKFKLVDLGKSKEKVELAIVLMKQSSDLKKKEINKQGNIPCDFYYIQQLNIGIYDLYTEYLESLQQYNVLNSSVDHLQKLISNVNIEFEINNILENISMI